MISSPHSSLVLKRSSQRSIPDSKEDQLFTNQVIKTRPEEAKAC